MKIRCVENSIRLRLRKSDIAILKQEKRLINTLNFPLGNYLNFGIIIIKEKGLDVKLENSELIVGIPQSIALEWFDSNRVSLEKYLPLADKRQLHVLIEKDFPCKHVEEDFEDTFHELQPDETAC